MADIPIYNVCVNEAGEIQEEFTGDATTTTPASESPNSFWVYRGTLDELDDKAENLINCGPVWSGSPDSAVGLFIRHGHAIKRWLEN